MGAILLGCESSVGEEAGPAKLSVYGRRMVTPRASLEDLEKEVPQICQSPKNSGVVEMIVRRPRDGAREVVTEAELDPKFGLIGDNWHARKSRSRPDGGADPEAQLNLMNSRVIARVAGERERWALAGDQFYLDLDLSEENLPPGTCLALGSALIEVTALPHLGCMKFTQRFGPCATAFVNSPLGKRLRFRGINAKIVQAGIVRPGDLVRKFRALTPGPALAQG